MLSFTKITLIKPVDILAYSLNIIILFSSLFLLFLHKNLPPLVPLWYSKAWGEERLAPPYSLWLIPLLTIAFFFLNNLLAKILVANNPVVAKILVWSSTFISLVAFFSLYKILLTVI